MGNSSIIDEEVDEPMTGLNGVDKGDDGIA